MLISITRIKRLIIILYITAILKILIITPDIYPFERGYGGRITLLLRDGFKHLGCNVDILSSVPDNENTEIVEKNDKIKFIKLYNTKHSTFKYFMPLHFHDFIQLKKFFNENLESYDLIILNDYLWSLSLTALILIKKCIKEKIMLISHGIMYYNNNKILFIISKIVNKVISNIFLTSIGGILSFSNKSHEELLKIFKYNIKRVVLPFCLDEKNIKLTHQKSIDMKNDVLNKFKNIFDINNFIFSISSISYHKGFHVMLEAAGMLLTNGYDFDVVIAGKKNDDYIVVLNEIIKKYKMESKVHFIGEIDDIEKYVLLRACKIFVIPSLNEGFGVGAEEAMLLNVRTIATDTGAHKDMLGNIYYNYIVRPGNINDLKEAIEKCIKTNIITTPVLNEKRLNELSCNNLCSEIINFMKIN